MAHESFEDAEVAALLNYAFISIKVDKEERPDIDAVYMTACQILTGSGGWPLTIMMSPEQQPFYAGTYLPKRRRYGHMGLIELLHTVIAQWDSDRKNLLQAGQQITQALQELDAQSAENVPDGLTAAQLAAAHLCRIYDPTYGGFGKPPKFPMPHHALFLLRCHHYQLTETQHMVEKTLTSMLQGGIYDHIGGGLSRYSTDTYWLAPHFEKMLYDNALLVFALLECYQVTGNAQYRQAAEHTVCYIAREMTSPQHGFYSAQDADSDGEEGKFYTFTMEEVLRVLGKEAGLPFCERYNITQAGNFEGKNIPNLIGGNAPLFDEAMHPMRATLYAYRGKRFALHKDDKQLTAWNGLMIAAYAKAYQVLGNQIYLEAAVLALHFIQSHLTDTRGRLLVSYREGEAKGKGLLDDYAFLCWACLELYNATFDAAHLQQACALADTIVCYFSAADGGFYLNPKDGEPLIVRPRELADGAMPSGNSVAAWCLQRLSALTGDAKWEEAAQKQRCAFSHLLLHQPWACTFALTAFMQDSCPVQQLICVVHDAKKAAGIATQVGKYFLPGLRTLVIMPENFELLKSIAPITNNYPAVEAESMFYLCQNQRCLAPTHDFNEILRLLFTQA